MPLKSQQSGVSVSFLNSHLQVALSTPHALTFLLLEYLRTLFSLGSPLECSHACNMHSSDAYLAFSYNSFALLLVLCLQCKIFIDLLIKIPNSCYQLTVPKFLSCFLVFHTTQLLLLLFGEGYQESNSRTYACQAGTVSLRLIPRPSKQFKLLHNLLINK